MRKLIIVLLICVSTLLFYNIALSQTTRTSTGTGNWGTATTWSPSGVPAANDPVIIAAGHTITVNVIANCASLTYAAVTSNSTVTISGTNSLTITGALSMPRPSTSRTCTMSVNTGTLSCGSLTMSATTSGRNNIINITTGTVTISGAITTGTTGCQITFTSTGTLNIGGAFSSTPTLTTVSGCTVNYNGSGAQTMLSTNYNGNVICSGSGTKTFGTSGVTLTVNGDLTVKTGSILKTANISSFQLTVKGTFTVETGATVTVGGSSGGRLVITGTGKSHSISGTINIYWAMRFDNTSASTSTITVNSGGIITTDQAAEGQLALDYGIDMTIASGATLNNNCIVQTLCGILISATTSGTSLIVNGTLNNGAAASFNILGTITINGVCNYTSGFFRSGSNGLVYGSAGTLAYVGGTLNPSTYEWPTTNSPCNVKIYSTGNITLNAARTINGTLSLMQSQLVNGTYLTMGNGATIDRSGGTMSAVPTFNTNCNVIYSNTADITSGPELPPATGTILNNLTMQSTSDKIVTFTVNATVKGTLTLTSGNIATGSFTLTLGTGTGNIGTLIINSNPIDNTGIISGNFKRWFSNTSTALTRFPVGDVTIGFGTGLYPKKQFELAFSSIGTGGSVTVKYVKGDPHSYNTISLQDLPYSYDIDSYSKIGSWEVTPADGLASYTYSINIYPTGAIGATNHSELRVLKRTSATSDPWVFEGTHSAGSGPMPDLQASRTGLTSFSTFALGGASIDGNTLDGLNPVELASFNANIISRDVKLFWTTATETNNAGFEIQKSVVSSKELVEWTKVGYIAGNGTKTTPTNYTFEDKKLNTGKYNYRLKQVDYNGNFEYHNLSSIVEVGVPNKFELSQNYPNPFNPTTKIDFELPYDSKVSLKLYDISGREMITLVNEQRTAGYYTVQMNAGNLSSGTYFYRINVEGNGQSFVSVKKLVLIK